MRLYDYQVYFETLARAYTGIGTFLAQDISDKQDFMNEIKNALSLVFLLEGYSRVSTSDTGSELSDVISGSFVVLQRIDTRAAVPKLMLLAAAEEAALQLRAKMLHDAKYRCGIMSALVAESITVNTVLTDITEWGGFRVEFSFSVNEQIAPNTLWKPEFNTWHE